MKSTHVLPTGESMVRIRTVRVVVRTGDDCRSTPMGLLTDAIRYYDTNVRPLTTGRWNTFVAAVVLYSVHDF